MSRALLFVALLGSIGCARSVAARGTGWWRVNTDHVQLDTDLDRAHAVSAGWAFEDDYRALAHVFPQCEAPEISERVSVTMIAHGDEYDHFAMQQTSGFFRPARAGIVGDDPTIVVRSGSGLASGYFTQVYVHELTHRFVARCYPEAPAWLHEGMARFFETMQVGRDVVVGIAPYRVAGNASWVSPFLSGGLEILQVSPRRMPVPSALVALSDADFYRLDTRSWNYASGWALIHMLSLGGDAALRTRFTQYLAGTADHGADAAWFGRAFEGVDLDREFQAYLSTQRLERRVRYTPPPLDDPPARALSPGEAHLRLAGFSSRRGDQAMRDEVLAHLALAAEERDTRVRAHLVQLEMGAVDEGTSKQGFIAALEQEHPDDLDVLSTAALFEVSRERATNRGRALLDRLARRDDLRAVDIARIADLALNHHLYARGLALARRAVQYSPSATTTHGALARALWQNSYRAESMAERRLALITAGHGGEIDAIPADTWPESPGFDPPLAAPTPTPIAEAPDDSSPLAQFRGIVPAPTRASTLDPSCIGFVGEPIAILTMPEAGLPIVVRTNGPLDMVLVVEDAQHHVWCDDDSGGDTNAAVYVPRAAGPLAVRVGSFRPMAAHVPYDVVVELGDRPMTASALPTMCDLTTPSWGGLTVGARVVLGRHRPVRIAESLEQDPIRDENWEAAMEPFVGRTAHVVQRTTLDGAGCPVVRVDVDDRTWLWRVRDLTPPPP